MNSETLRQIFKAPFEYKTFCNDIVHRLFGCNDIASRLEMLDTNAEGDKSYFIGQMDDADGRLLGFFYTRVADGSDVRRKRVGLRKLISPYLKYDVDGAIAVFDDGCHWRLSYICDLKDGSTSAKRFSYIMGDEQGQYKTPIERLGDVAKLNGRWKLSDLKESFSVDALSDEFFDEYHVHYDRIVAELARQGKSGAVYHDYVKKMMGRIVFLHFLQKKGWLCGNQAFLRDLFFFSPYQTDFLEQVLEPLFFGIFNTESKQRERLFVDEHWDKGLLQQWEEMPYLNGGLFERDAIDRMVIKLPASLFENLFAFLASYNFTVDENDPDDAEIGVDPEMLGKIFESLLEDNKAKGAFYTPKEIVRYMCKESLIAHLASKLPDVADGVVRAFVESHEMQPELEPYRDILESALREVKICDPAIGSGAFPMGLLNELWRCREALGTQLSRLQLKKEIIENNIYGVDIERGAIDIARLRFWLSIVVDSEKAEPLPNFDYKFMQGNSLIESYGGFDLSRIAGKTVGRPSTSTQYVIGLDSDLSQKNLQRLLREYFSVTDHQKKATMRSAINAEVKTLIRESVGGTPTFLAKLEQLDPSANQDFFLWHTWFKDIFDKGGFDIVIGNPPYIQLQTNGGKLGDLYENCGFETYTRMGDIYSLFYERGWSVLDKGGVLCFITSNKWMRAGYGEKTRRFFALKTNPKLLIDLGANVFENATVDTNILLFAKSKNTGNTIGVTFNADKESLENLSQYVQKQSSKCSFLVSDSWVILSPIEQSIKTKIETKGTPLKDWDIQINYGIKTGCNEAFVISTEKRKEILSNCKSDEERKKTEDIIHPILRGRDIRQYSYNWAGLWIVYIPWHFPLQFDNNIQGASKKAEFAFQIEYPSVYNHLLKYKEQLSNRNKAEIGIRYEWYALQRWGAKYWEDFYKPKLFYADISQSLNFVLCIERMFCNNTTYFMSSDDAVFLEKIAHYLNSPLIDWYYRTLSVQLGDRAMRLFSIYVLKIPIPKSLGEDVFSEYGLTQEEIDFIKNYELEFRMAGE